MADEQLRSLSQPTALPVILAADARLSRTNYLDDQSWEIRPGSSDQPALALQTRYGGRVNLASLVPMWYLDNRSIYQAGAYDQPPLITHLAPGFAIAQGRLTPEISIRADYWVMESIAVGGRFTVSNESSQNVSLKLDLFGQVIAHGKPQKLAIVSLSDMSTALSMGKLPHLEPIVVLERTPAQPGDGGRPSPKITSVMTIAPGGQGHVRWVHAGLETMVASLERCHFWLNADWEQAFETIARAARAIPTVETGDAELDNAIALSHHYLAQAFMESPAKSPHFTLIASRQPGRGFSRSGDGSDYDRSWSGPGAHLAYLAAPAAATLHPPFALDVVRGFLAAQTDNGSIDLRPGPLGQRSGLLCPPLLARLTWEIFQLTEDADFLKEVFPGLLKFFRRWGKSESDADYDGLPEWQDERQTGYTFWPTFSAAGSWAQGAEIRYFETPDMAAYLLSEAVSLQRIADTLNDSVASASLADRTKKLKDQLDKLWKTDRYVYRDRDTNAATTGETILHEGRGDEDHILAFRLSTPTRIIVRLIGGADKTPRASMILEGLDSQGRPVSENVDTAAFRWHYNQGVFTSRRVYSQVDRVRFSGLSRVYRVSVTGVDTTRLDINACLPVWTGQIPAKKANRLIGIVTDETAFWRPNGVTIVSAQDSGYDPSSANGGGGIWPFWLMLIGEGLLAYQRADLVVEMLRRILRVQPEVLRHEASFSEFYHCDEPLGLGEDHYLGGIVPLHLLMRVLGVRIMSAGRVWTGGAFAWGEPVTIRQHGVVVRRSAGGSEVSFPSGFHVKLPSDAPWQAVEDPQAALDEAEKALPQNRLPQAPSNRVIITIQHETSD